MGDRISISFKDNMQESIVLFNHWGGRSFLAIVEQYIAELDNEIGIDKQSMPLDRRESGIVMVDFIRWLTKDDKRVTSSLYLGKNSSDGDNSDNGHWTFDLTTGKWKVY